MTTARSQALAALNDFQTSIRKIVTEAGRLYEGRTDKKALDLFQLALQQLFASDEKLQDAVTVGTIVSAPFLFF
jgi:hypothetical protein